jgi:MFS family permease
LIISLLNKAYRRYVLGLLTLICTLNYLDRGLIILLLQPIKEDLHLSDTQLGFLTGIAFGLFYATLGLPIARWADRGNRATITSLAIGLWGVTVMLCLLVTNYFQLLLARVAAGVGEAGCMPPTYSLLGDYFPGSAERTRAMTMYWLASPLAALISFMAGGRLNEWYGWRKTFFIMGIPALVVAVLVRFTLVEPRKRAAGAQRQDPQLPRMADVLRVLWRRRSSRHLIIAIILLWTMGLGMSPWYAAFMIRSHGMGTAELGLWFGLIFGLGSAAGVLAGGHIAARWFADNERGQMRLSAVMIGLLVPCFTLFLLLPRTWEALLALVPLMVVFSVFAGPAFALMQRLVVDEMRATTLAVVMLLANLIGMGIGPQIVGFLSDVLRPLCGSDSLRYSMLALSLVALWAAYHFWQVGETVSEDLSTVTLPHGATRIPPAHRDELESSLP